VESFILKYFSFEVSCCFVFHATLVVVVIVIIINIAPPDWMRKWKRRSSKTTLNGESV